MQRRFLSQEDQKTVHRWQLAVVSVYSSIAVIVVLLAYSPARRDNPTIEAKTNTTVAQVVHVIR
jgi:hypothetical protein